MVLDINRPVQTMGAQSAAPVTAGLDALVGRLGQAVRSGTTRTLAWRRAQLDGIIQFLAEREHELAAALDADLGKPALAGWMADIVPPRNEARYALRHLAAWVRPRRVSVPIAYKPGRAWVEHEPKGVVLIVAPWNYPVQLCLSPLVGAVAAGNAAVVKPSELAPATGRVLAEWLPRYLDRDAVAVVEGGMDVSQALLDLPFDHIFFTGSPRVGRIVMGAAARHLTPVTLELGGKSPVIVAADADLDVAARRIAWAKLVNAGQTCIAPDYVLVERSIRPAFVDRLITHVERFAGSAEPTRIVNETHLRRLAALLDDHGGVTALEGGPDMRTGRFAPVVITDPDPESALMQEEIFGPILPVVVTESLDESIAFVAARPKPLALYLFTGSSHVEQKVLERTSSGSVCVNHLLYQCLVPELPFGGVGPAGMGVYHGRAGFETFSHAKAVLRKPTTPDRSVAYPPYSSSAERAFRLLLR